MTFSPTSWKRNVGPNPGSRPSLANRGLTLRTGQAVHVLDRFHITRHLNQAVDQVRRAESTRLRACAYGITMTAADVSAMSHQRAGWAPNRQLLGWRYVERYG